MNKLTSVSVLAVIFILSLIFTHAVSAQLYVPLPGMEDQPIVPLIRIGGYPRPTPIPLGLNVDLHANSDGATYNVGARWNNFPNAVYSLALHYNPGGDPGPNIDTDKNYWIFYNVRPGTYYIDIKVGQNGYWSVVQPWSVIVPAWQPPTTPTPYTTQVDNSSSGLSTGVLLFFGSIVCVIVSLVLYIKSRKPKI